MFLAQPIIIPPGQDPNLGTESDESLVWAILLSNGLFIPLVTIVIALRIYTKLSMAKQIFLDDYLMTASALLFLTLASLDVAAVPLGFGVHIQNLPGDTMPEQLNACVFGWIRVVSAVGLGNLDDAVDATYADVEYFNWSVAEAGLCIITGSIPALRPLLAIILPRLFGQYNMDEFVETVKGTVSRVATRPGSRSRSRAGSRAGSRLDHRRRSSDGTIKSLPGILREHTYNEIESPKTEQAGSLSSKVPVASKVMASVSSIVMRTTCSLMKVFHRRDIWEDEERGRSRLSVINELDEVTSSRENEKHEVSSFGIRIGLANSVADVQWWWARSRLNPWRLKGPVKPSPGVVIIMTEVMVTSAKMDVQQHQVGYPV
ncbi:hypothetical protein N0V82_005687 [Gnomoniopsis sp. IMI 355080]|nr:hypothetical protein N0V82_005687 [Gnomoniopsis sp. IMI 355080]